MADPKELLSDPFTPVEGLEGHAWFNLPSLLIMPLVTAILVLGIRESARTNALLVIIKVGSGGVCRGGGLGLREPATTGPQCR